MKLTRFSQGANNSVVVYQSQMTWLLQEEIPESIGSFVDDQGMKVPRSLQNQGTLPESPSIRRFIWEYAIALKQILLRIKKAGLTISGSKFAFCVPALEMVGHVV
ncbi:hypothetical protein O181_041167 [Austropuccinia psidii MF-1]|uniref:Reverse transcriptase n=1 Tax=Austropuccinia psidii MF-1 TaxID=1389203 RepID=A0A9Q3DK93_9BASI|nr:hypothetical protein [Austropuccinia psidii MF-1]